MTSDRQLAANRRNALRSTGPRTIEGRAASSRNAERHGVLSQRVVSELENLEAYEQMLESLRLEFSPRSQTETLLVERLANLFWRERRLVQSERNQIVEAEANMFRAVPGSQALLPLGSQLLIGRYQTMLTNQISATIAQLNALLGREET